MTIEEKLLKIREHCNSMQNCYGCKLYKVEPSCWHVSIFGSDEDIEKLYNVLTYGASKDLTASPNP